MAQPDWHQVHEECSASVLVALYLRQALGVRHPDALPQLRGVARGEDAVDDVERLWRGYWDMTVEPEAHHSPAPLELVDGFGTHVALPADAVALRDAALPHGASALAYAHEAADRYERLRRSYRGYAGAVVEFERRAGRRAHDFRLNVQVLPLSQRGIWWIGALTVAVSDSLRGDVAAFDAAMQPILRELA
ncbi:zinc-binding alcohol dehydrogenase [Microbacterium marinilacus]|uniref:Zinc-binding alcohol dehydrogenase n=1 Tax=Microbacterium marinilacus TaxID=415209 RepID=A0ABP7BG76_9MICO|nr:zinc-binding alcohol dehydrogenase [Microbacterium marinilacus]MBY0690158.1 zinc-binding alcohol dehydrogenase [Microbacterium marinilacus]